MKLTSTNSSIDLIVPIACAHHKFQALTHERAFGPMLREGAKRLAERSRALWENLSEVIPPNQKKYQNQLLNSLLFADLVVMAGWLHPFPYRTRP